MNFGKLAHSPLVNDLKQSNGSVETLCNDLCFPLTSIILQMTTRLALVVTSEQV